MTSKIVVNNIEADAGVSTVTFNSNVERGSSNLHSTGLNVNNTFVHSTGIALGAGSTVGAVTGVTTYYGDGSQLTGIDAGTLKHNNNTKAQATANGVTITGDLIPAANNTHDLGSTAIRWANIFTNDLNLSNKGSTNSVDNTWGDYTIEEGENDLFLINNRNGKKFKFNLTEVS